MINYISGGVCAAKGFKAGAVNCEIKKGSKKRDLSLIVSEKRCSAAGVYTKNKVKGAPITVTKKNIADGYARAVIANSGNANTCNANGIEIAEAMCALVEEYSGIDKNDVIVASTGVIGQKLDITPIKNGMKELVDSLCEDGSGICAEGIMTTDTKMKEVAVEFELGGKKCHIGAIAKGSGMIHPNMATMLCFITSDVAIESKMLEKALKNDIESSFNMVSVDRDTSTNDTVCILANGMAENKVIDGEGEDFDEFCSALSCVTKTLSKKIAKDGEGASRLIECNVSGARDTESARIVAKSVVCSNLFKAAVFGADANWGRVLCAIGYAPCDVDINKVSVEFESNKGKITVCKDGAGVDFSEEEAKKILLEDEIKVNVTLKDGDSVATAWGCDLTYDYVKINGDYRS